jgi:hypothetical protein
LILRIKLKNKIKKIIINPKPISKEFDNVKKGIIVKIPQIIG